MSTALRPLFVNVTWGAGGSTAAKSLELAEICQRQLGLTTCLHLTCTNMNRSLIDEALEQAKALGIRNILALRGDPPRSNEYRNEGAPPLNGDHKEEFVWAIDLVRYIREHYGNYFCVGVAAYPEGHADQSHPEKQDPLFDLPYLVEKTRAGADFLMTQLFFDVKAYRNFEQMLREHPSGMFQDIPIIPGLMPVQSYQILRRTTKLSHAKLPPDILARFDAVKGDDAAVKQVGVDILSEIVETIKATPSPSPRGFHFYTLNLEKAVAHILERCNLLPPFTPNDSIDDSTTTTIDDTNDIAVIDEPNDTDFILINSPSTHSTKDPPDRDRRRRLSSINSNPHNRVVVSRPASSLLSDGNTHTALEAPEDEAGIPSLRTHTLAISEGEGALGREATWDDFPNGRWGDARSPAFGDTGGYGYGGGKLHVSPREAVALWGHPVAHADLAEVFRRHVRGEVRTIPWSESEEGLNAETGMIQRELLRLIADRGWWSVASQPAVNGVRSTDPVFGWGPRNGFVFQKPFVEFFLPAKDWKSLRQKLGDRNDEVTYFAGNGAGEFAASDEKSVNPVTWGAFSGKEYVLIE